MTTFNNVTDAFDFLRTQKVSELSEWEASFFGSILRQTKKKALTALSEKQQACIVRIANEKATPREPLPSIMCAGLIGLFDTAAENLKWPKITMQFKLTTEVRDRNRSLYGGDLRDLDTLPDDVAAMMVRCFDTEFSIRFQRAGENSAHPGCLQITNGLKYHQREWYGRILTDGTFEMGPKCTAEVREFVEAFNEYTTLIATFFGRNSGNCCYCNRWLTDERSLDAGYGPTCAKNYRQPWGNNA